MQYLSGAYWQRREHNSAGLVLQQVFCRKKRTPVLFAGICTSAGPEQDFLLSGLLTWFYERGLSLCARGGEKGWDAAVNSLEHATEALFMRSKDGGNRKFAGILCAGYRFVLFGQGGHRICLVNIRNRKPHCRDIGDTSGAFYRKEGFLQKGIGILLATDSFYQKTDTLLADCLKAEDMYSQDCLDRHLKELGDYGGQRGGENLGAVYFCVK